MVEQEHRIRIMVVDDEARFREGAARFLSRHGHQVNQAGNGEEALDLHKSQPVDLVFLDLKMPGLDGLEVLTQLKAADADILVVIITGHGTIDTAIEAMKKGAYDFLTKPFKPEQIKFIVDRAVELIRLRRERDRLALAGQKGLWTITTDQSRLKTVINSIGAGILILELDRRIVMSNPAFGRMMGVDPASLIGTQLGQNPRLQVIDQMADDVIRGAGEGSGVTEEFVIEHDRPTYIRATVSPVISETGQLLGLVAALRDITYFKEAEQEKSGFVAMLTHELRAPLSAVDTQFHVILKGLAGELNEKQRETLGRMRARVKNVLFMINELLDLSKIENKQFVQEKQPLNLNEVVAHAAETLRPSAEEKSLDLDLHLDPNLPPIMGDDRALKEVSLNLISNAIRYTLSQGRIDVSTSVEGPWTVLTVADTGIGIPKEYQTKIFDRFFRVKDERTRYIVGTGLGLAIVQGIVAEHGGTIALDSEPGRGTTFKVMLPAVRER